jgi:hypothetical protein
VVNSPDTGQLTGIAAVSSDDVWAVGANTIQHYGPFCTITFSDVPAGAYFYPAVQYLVAHGAISGYTDPARCPAGQTPCFNPSATATRAQVMKITLVAAGIALITPQTATFVDVPTDNVFFSIIETAVAHHIVGGYTDPSRCPNGQTPCFLPNNPVTRGQLSAIVAGAFNWTLIDPPVATFRDVPVGSTFYRFIETAVSKSILGGYPCGDGCREFRPGNNALRSQIATIVYNAVLSR